MRVRTERGAVLSLKWFHAHGMSLTLLRELKAHVPMAVIELADGKCIRVHCLDLSAESIKALNTNVKAGEQ